MAPMMTVRVSRSKHNPDNIRDGTVRVGWFAGIRYDDSTPVAQVAQWNEYGTPNAKYPIPARPFMRPVMHTQGQHLKEQIKALYGTALRNNKSTIKALEKFGEIVLDKIQSQIRSNVYTPNAPITLRGGWLRSASGQPFYVEKKRGRHPLIDTGFMLDSIDYQIEISNKRGAKQ